MYNAESVRPGDFRVQYPLRLTILLLSGIRLLAQNSPSVASHGGGVRAPTTRICSEKNPPPCATAPHPVFTPAPEYSKEARDAGYQGTSVLRLVVGPDGRP